MGVSGRSAMTQVLDESTREAPAPLQAILRRLLVRQGHHPVEGAGLVVLPCNRGPDGALAATGKGNGMPDTRAMKEPRDRQRVVRDLLHLLRSANGVNPDASAEVIAATEQVCGHD